MSQELSREKRVQQANRFVGNVLRASSGRQHTIIQSSIEPECSKVCLRNIDQLYRQHWGIDSQFGPLHFASVP